MKNKKKLIIALGCMALACAGFAACAPKSVIEKNQEIQQYIEEARSEETVRAWAEAQGLTAGN